MKLIHLNLYLFFCITKIIYILKFVWEINKGIELNVCIFQEFEENYNAVYLKLLDKLKKTFDLNLMILIKECNEMSRTEIKHCDQILLDLVWMLLL